VIDDDPASRELMQRHLARAGYRTHGASGGASGLALARELKPAAITLDVLMPEMDGFAFLSALRERENGKSVPVIVVSALDLTAEHRKRLSGGVQQILKKGAYTPEFLLDELRGVLSPSAIS